MTRPRWLDKIAQDYWDKHIKHVSLQPEQAETFAVLCQSYSDYRQSETEQIKCKHLDFYLKLAKEFGLTPRTHKIRPESGKDELEQFLDSKDT